MFGTTERGDASVDMSWVKKMDTVDATVLITKNPTDKFIENILKFKNKAIVHLTCTGFGGTKVEPNVPRSGFVFEQYKKMIKMGFPAHQVTLRVDPIIPTEKGLQTAMKVLDMNKELENPIRRIKISFLDMYKHVEDRFEKAGLQHPYGNGVMHAPSEMKKAALDTLSKRYPDLIFECCAEEAVGYSNIHQIGCISYADMILLGKDPILLDKAGSANQRKECMCPSNKTELLNNAVRCCHGCLYCYWHDPKPKKIENKEKVNDVVEDIADDGFDSWYNDSLDFLAD